MIKRVAAASALLALWAAGALLAQEKLTYQPKEGTVKERTTVKLHQVLTLAGMDLDTSGDTEAVTRQVVAKRADDGTLRVQNTQEMLKVSLSLPGNMSLKFDSTKGNDQKADNPMFQPLIDTWTAMRGLTYTVVLDKANQPTSIEGIDKALGAAPAAVAADLKRELDPQKLIREFKEGRGFLPDGPVKKGDRWERMETDNIGGGQVLKFDTFYEYQGTVERAGKTLDKIGIFRSTVAYSQDAAAQNPLKHVSSDLKIDASSGTILFDREAGEAIETTNSTRITGPMVFDFNGMQLPGKLDLTIDSTTVREK